MTDRTTQSQTAVLRKRFESVEAAAVAGIAFAILAFIASSLLTAQPQPSASSEELSAWFADSDNTWSMITGLSLTTVAAVTFLWFIAVIRRRVGDREDQFFATVFLGSGILVTALLLMGATAIASVAIGVELLGGQAPDAGAFTAISGLAHGLLLIVLPRVEAVFIITTSTVGFRTGAFPRWLALFGYVVGLGMFIIPILLEPLLLVFPAWVGVMSLALLIRRKRVHSSDSPPA
jgi:hypothetical protein